MNPSNEISRIDQLILQVEHQLSILNSQRQSLLNELNALRDQKALLLQAGKHELPANAYHDTPLTDAKVTKFSPEHEKITLFRSLFKGRPDVFPKRFESKSTGKSGYQPVCRNDWVAGVCDKPRTKCIVCPNKAFLPVSDEVIRSHLMGRDLVMNTIGDFIAGVYPLLQDETCCFLALDFDKSTWTADAISFLKTCNEFSVPAVLERSRSGNGAHIWIFFSEPISASIARKMGTFLLSRTIDARPEIGLQSYDRLFPNQDTMPLVGSLIHYPLNSRHNLSMKLDSGSPLTLRPE